MYIININGDLDEGDNRKIFTELDGLSIALEINEEGNLPTWRCTGCGDEFSEGEPPQDPCEGSSNFIDCGEHVLDADGDCESCDGSGKIEVHEWEPIPLHWANSASIHTDTDRDEITVAISVGDPRGAFVMRVERIDGELYLSVPHANMSLPHMPLTERSPGWFKIG